MKGKMNAIGLALLMIASALAGCTSGDPDGDGELGIDTDVLNQMIEDNLQDFINNSSVTVHQTIHYHNNTTYVVDDGDYSTTNHAHFNNTTNVDGGEINNFDQSETTYNIGGASFGEGVNGSVNGGDMLFVAHIAWTAMDLFPDYEPPGDPQDNDFTYTYTYYDYLTNQQRTDIFTFSCGVFYIVGSQSNGSSNQVSYWEDNNNYYNAWEQMYNSTIADLLNEAAYTSYVENLCRGSLEGPIASANDGYSHTFLTIDLPVGYAIEYVQLQSEHSYYGCSEIVDLEYYYSCLNAGNNHYSNSNTMFWNYSASSESNISSGNVNFGGALYGGWNNLSLEFSISLSSYERDCRNGSGDYLYDNNGNRLRCNYDYGHYSIWPTSEYFFTLYYRFVPVIPVE
mgnify:CR=1 FL=1